MVKCVGVCIGLAHKQQLEGSGYTRPQDYQGLYVIGDGGYVLNPLDPEQHDKESSFVFS